MKRTIQTFAMLLIGLLAAAPAFAALSCTSNMEASCPMGMAGMTADCPMSQNLATVDCPQDCCSRTSPQASLIPVFPVKTKFSAITLGALQLPPMPLAETASTPSFPLRMTASPPRYILLRVFRI